MAARKDYYAILGLHPNASSREVRAQFKRLARQRHPDLFQGDEKEKAEAEFQAITEAFNILRDPTLRREHDLELSSMASGRRQGHDADSLARIYIQRGIQAYNERKWIQAAESFNRATETQPDNAQAWHHLALACSKRPLWRSHALNAINRACELESMNVEFLKLAGQIHAAAGLAQRAEKFYTEALKWGGEDADVEEALGELKRKASKR